MDAHDRAMKIIALPVFYVTRRAGGRRAITHHRTKAAAVAASKRRLRGTTGSIDVDECDRTTCRVVAQVRAVETFRPSAQRKGGRWTRTVSVASGAGALPHGAANRVYVLNGARRRR